MKANEAPEKIYLATTEEVQNLDHSLVGIAHSDPQDIVEPIEYVRKYAFIEKACQFIKEHHHEFSFWNTEEYELGFSTQKFIEDFKKYMEG